MKNKITIVEEDGELKLTVRCAGLDIALAILVEAISKVAEDITPEEASKESLKMAGMLILSLAEDNKEVSND